MHAIGSIQCSCIGCRPAKLSDAAVLIQLFDAVTTSRCYVSLHAKHFVDDLAELTLTAWCAAHQVPMHRHAFTCDARPMLSTVAKLPNGSELVVIAEVRS
jgi:hypothetical protein